MFTSEELTTAFALLSRLDPDRYSHPATKSLILKCKAAADAAEKAGSDGKLFWNLRIVE